MKRKFTVVEAASVWGLSPLCLVLTADGKRWENPLTGETVLARFRKTWRSR